MRARILSSLLLPLLLFGGGAYAASPFMEIKPNRTKAEIADAIRTGRGLNIPPTAFVFHLQTVTGEHFDSVEEAADFIEGDDVTLEPCDPETFGEREVLALEGSIAVTRTRGCDKDRSVLMYDGQPIMFPRCANPIKPLPEEVVTEEPEEEPACTPYVDSLHAFGATHSRQGTLYLSPDSMLIDPGEGATVAFPRPRHRVRCVPVEGSEDE